jgi:hypothetical protein
MLRHLDEEDAVLLPYTARLLSPDDWSTVVSSMSSLVERCRPLQR